MIRSILEPTVPLVIMYLPAFSAAVVWAYHRGRLATTLVASLFYLPRFSTCKPVLQSSQAGLYLTLACAVQALLGSCGAFFIILDDLLMPSHVS